MINKNLLRAEWAKKGYSQAQVAEQIGISEKTLSLKVNGKGIFGTDEIQKLIDLLDIKDPMAIFFASKVTCEVTEDAS